MTLSFAPNPVAVRESRAMWRGARSFLLLACYVGALALVAYLAYSSEVRSAAYWAKYNPGETLVHSARVGHTLFVALSYVQIVAWLLIAPALAATSISSERERGLLESLLMSRLHPRQVIAGKFWVCASFVLVLIVATLPILAMCFLLGGVSPGEFGGALAIQLSTAFCALSLGLWCSASSRLSTHALGATFGILGLWLFGTFFCMTYDYSSNNPAVQAMRFLGLLNPLVGLNELLDPNSYPFRSFFLDASLRWPICIVAQVLVGARFLVLASRRVSKSLDEEEAPAIPRRAVNFAEASEAGVPSTWGTPEVLESASTSDREAYFEVPILKHIVFGGPLMRHYLRSAWRWKKPRSRSLRIWKLGVLAFAIGNLSALRWMDNDPQYAPSSVLIFLIVASAMLIPIFVTASGGLSIARDRELGIWNHLRLSNIRSSEIALAKMFAPLIASLAYCVLLLGPLLLVALWVFRGNTEPDSWRWREVSQLYLFAPIWLLGTIQLSGWAAICSMRARRSSIGLVASFAGALIFLFGVLIVFEVGFGSDGNYQAHRATQQWLGLLHPFYAMGNASYLANSDSWSRPDIYIASLFSHSAFAFAFYRVVESHIARREK